MVFILNSRLSFFLLILAILMALLSLLSVYLQQNGMMMLTRGIFRKLEKIIIIIKRLLRFMI